MANEQAGKQESVLRQLLLERAALGPDEGVIDGVKRLIARQSELAGKLDACEKQLVVMRAELDKPQGRMQAAVLSSDNGRRDQVMTGALALPGGRRVVCRHIGSYEAGGDCGILFHDATGKNTLMDWYAPMTDGGKPLDQPTRIKIRDAIMEGVDRLFNVHDMTE